MNLDTAYRVALESMAKELKTLHYDANLHEDYGADCPVAIRAYERRRKVERAIVRIQEELYDDVK